MKKNKLVLGCLITFALLVVNFQLALAHEGVTAGTYEIEVGWVTEPPIAGQQNAIVVNVMNMSSGAAQPVEDVVSLTIIISYGGQSKTLTLQPLGEDTPGQFVAPILPTIPGQYTITLGGKLGDTDVKADVEPEEVQPATAIQFPAVDGVQQNSNADWLNWLSMFIALIGVGVGVTALRKASMR